MEIKAEGDDFWKLVYAIVVYDLPSAQGNYKVCFTESELEETRVSLLFDPEVTNLRVRGPRING